MHAEMHAAVAASTREEEGGQTALPMAVLLVVETALRMAAVVLLAVETALHMVVETALRMVAVAAALVPFLPRAAAAGTETAEQYVGGGRKGEDRGGDQYLQVREHLLAQPHMCPFIHARDRRLPDPIHPIVISSIAARPPPISQLHPQATTNTACP
jgi:hypothetical protein